MTPPLWDMLSKPLISASAFSGESLPWMMFSPVLIAKSPRFRLRGAHQYAHAGDRFAFHDLAHRAGHHIAEYLREKGLVRHMGVMHPQQTSSSHIIWRSRSVSFLSIREITCRPGPA